MTHQRVEHYEHPDARASWFIQPTTRTYQNKSAITDGSIIFINKLPEWTTADQLNGRYLCLPTPAIKKELPVLPPCPNPVRPLFVTEWLKDDGEDDGELVNLVWFENGKAIDARYYQMVLSWHKDTDSVKWFAENENFRRDRRCVFYINDGDGECYLINVWTEIPEELHKFFPHLLKTWYSVAPDGTDLLTTQAVYEPFQMCRFGWHDDPEHLRLQIQRDIAYIDESIEEKIRHRDRTKQIYSHISNVLLAEEIKKMEEERCQP